MAKHPWCHSDPRVRAIQQNRRHHSRGFENGEKDHGEEVPEGQSERPSSTQERHSQGRRVRSFEEREDLTPVSRPVANHVRVGALAATPGVRFFELACERDLEGIVGKYARGTYQADSTLTSWVKVKNRTQRRRWWGWLTGGHDRDSHRNDRARPKSYLANN